MFKLLISAAALMTSFSLQAECLSTPVHGEKLITSNFGMRYFANRQPALRLHKGMDLRAHLMTHIYAAATGNVSYRGYSGIGGETLEIQSDDGITTEYLHLSAYKVHYGENVTKDQLIAFSGDSSDIPNTQAHLHFMVDVGGIKKDPKGYMCEKLAEQPDAGPFIDPEHKGPPSDPAVALDAGYGKSSSTQASYNGSNMPSSAPNYKGWDGRSEQEIMFSEISRRYLNPVWQSQIATCNPDVMLIGSGNSQYIDGGKMSIVDCDRFMYNELVEINGLQLLMDSKKLEARERIELMLATSLAERTKRGSSETLDKMRASAAKSAGFYHPSSE